MHRHGLRRGATLAAGLAIAVGSINLIGLSAASAATDPPTIALSLPSTLGNGGDPATGSATIVNPATGADIAAARVDFVISAPTGTTLTASDFVVKYESAPAVFTDIPLTSNGDGTVSGYFGPAAGFPIPTSYNQTTPLEIATNPGAPNTTLTTTAYLDTTPGTTSSAVAHDAKTTTTSTPSLSFTGYPSTLPGNGDYAAYTGTLSNQTGSDYSGVRLDFSIASSAAINASDLTLNYCLGGTGTSCTGGTWTQIPLSGSGNTITGFYGPAAGFALPNTASNTTPFEIKAGLNTPATTLTTTVNLDKVDGTGATTGTDSNGVSNGTITSVTQAPVTVAIVEPTLTFNLPTSLGIGGDLQSASATYDNTGGAERDNVRYDLEITPDAGTANLSRNDFVIYVLSGTNKVPVTLHTDSSGGGIHGYAPPSTGFTVDANHTDTSNLLVAAEPGAPVGSVTITANLDTTPGDTSTSIGSYTQDTKLKVPTVLFGTNYPKEISSGNSQFTDITAAVSNTTGSNYGGTVATTAPTVAGLRPTLSITSSNTAVTASQVVVQYCANGTTTACTGGTWTTIPLTGTGGALSAAFGPTTGWTVPNNSSQVVQLRAAVVRGTPNTTLTPTVVLNKVNPATGAATGTDSSGVDNGFISSSTGSAIAVVPFANPTIKATLKSAHAKSAAGWYRSPVTITFTCKAGSGALTTACPKTVVVSANTKKHVDTRTIKAADGGTASVTVTTKLDHTAPSAKISGAVNGHTYSARRHLTAHCSDSLSGVKSCKVTSHRSGNTVKWTVRAADKANNVTTHTGKYKIS